MLRDIELPIEIRAQLEAGADLAISISGGKDSQALAIVLSALHRTSGWTGQCYMIHADLGRIEWPETDGVVQAIANAAGLELVLTRRFGNTANSTRTDWDMIDRWKMNRTNRLARGKAGMPWSGPDKGRFCTGEMKTDPIDQTINKRRAFRTVCAVGIRREESASRANTPAWDKRSNDNTKRHSLTWNPLIHWTERDVWEAIGHKPAELVRRRADYANGRTELALAGWNAHPAYVYGNKRMGCSFCVLATINDLTVAARHRPELAAELIAMEVESGFTFQSGRSLASIVANANATSVDSAFADLDDIEVAA